MIRIYCAKELKIVEANIFVSANETSGEIELRVTCAGTCHRECNYIIQLPITRIKELEGKEVKKEKWIRN